MKPEIKAMLPELPISLVGADVIPEAEILLVSQFEAWLDKLTEGAEVMYGAPDQIWGSLPNAPMKKTTHTALLICPREINQAVPLGEVIEFLNRYSEWDAGELADRLEKFGVK